MPRYRAKVDSNQSEIVGVLRKAGASIESLATMGGGVPDLLVGVAGQNYLLEVKAPRGRLTPDQVDWHGEWRGHKTIVRSPEDALRAVGLMTR